MDSPICVVTEYVYRLLWAGVIEDGRGRGFRFVYQLTRGGLQVGHASLSRRPVFVRSCDLQECNAYLAHSY